MENLKINTQNEFQQKQIEKLFIELGVRHELFQHNFNYIYFEADADNELRGGWNSDDFNSLKFKEITLPELRDMVVLKRNSIEDATHILENGLKLYKDSKGNFLKMHRRFENDLARWVELDYASDSAKPIEKKEMKEYLVKSQDGKWCLETDLVGDPADDVIEVPNGANSATYGTHGDINFFFDFDFPEGRFKSGVVIWQRNPEPKQAEFLVKTDSGYVLQVLDENSGGADVVRVPEGAEIAVKSSRGYIEFRKGGSFYAEECEEWCKGSWHVNDFPKQGWDIVWKRETLDDQVASAEAARQEEFLLMLDIKFPSEQEIKNERLNRGDVNYRVAKAFNEIRGTDLTEDDIDYLRKFIDLTNSHYGERK